MGTRRRRPRAACRQQGPGSARPKECDQRFSAGSGAVGLSSSRAQLTSSNNRVHALATESISGQVQRGRQALGRVALGVAVCDAQIGIGQQVVGHAVGLVVDLVHRLVDPQARRPRFLDVARRLRAEHRQQHTQPHRRHAR
eukprot:3347559-Prymnesium_polylepis.2